MAEPNPEDPLMAEIVRAKIDLQLFWNTSSFKYKHINMKFRVYLKGFKFFKEWQRGLRRGIPKL